jgi:hypothetical protein
VVKSKNPIWSKDLQSLLRRNPGLRIVGDPGKLEYYRQDFNVDLPAVIRDLSFTGFWMWSERVLTRRFASIAEPVQMPSCIACASVRNQILVAF